MMYQIVLGITALLIPTLAFAGEGGEHSDPVANIALSIALILLAGRIGGRLFERMGQPAVLGKLMMGMMMGNLHLLSIEQLEFLRGSEVVDAIGRLGAIFLLFQAGLESSVPKMLKVGVTALNVATVGVVAPMILGYGTSWALLPSTTSWTVHLFAGATLSATSVGITAAVFKAFKATNTAEGSIVLGAAVIDDVLGLLVLAVVAGIIQHGTIEFASIALITVKAFAFLGGSLWLGTKVAPTVIRWMARLGEHSKVVTLIVAALGMSWAAVQIGLAGIVGAFAAGLILEEVHFQNHHSDRTAEQLVEPISRLLMPVFFVMMGFQVRLETFANVQVLGVAAALTVAAVIGKQVCGLPFRSGIADRLTVGLGMIPRGEVGLIFASIGRELGVVDESLFSAFVIMVVLTTVVTPPLLGMRLKQVTRTKEHTTIHQAEEITG